MDPRDRLFGELAVQLQFLTREQVGECVIAQHGEFSGRTLAEIAIARGMLARDDAEILEAQQAKLLEKRRGTIKRMPQVEEVVEQRAPKRDRRTDTTTPVLLEPERAAPPPKPAGAVAPARLNSMQMGHTLSAVRAPEVQLPRAPNPPMELAETRPGNDPDDPATRAAVALADTRPGSGADAVRTANTGAAAAFDDYDFGAASTSSSATIVGTGVPRKLPPAANSGQTIEQPSGAAARRAPADRAWRNPSRPPDEALTGVVQAPPPGPAQGAAEAGRQGTLVGNAAELAPRARAAAKLGAAAQAGRYLDDVLRLAVESGATDVHAHADAPLLARVDGLLLPLSGEAALAATAAEQVIAELMTDAQRQALAASGQARFTYELPGVGRFRAHVHRGERGLGAAFRVLPLLASTLETLSLPARLHSLLDPPRGLVLCAGPRGSGKTSTSAALVTALTEGLGVHAVCIDETGELAFRVRHGAVTCVQVPEHAPSYAAAIAQAQAVGARVISVSALDDAAAVFAALDAAAGGACVVACVPAANAAQAIERMLAAVDTTKRSAAAALLAETLRVVTSQRLLVQAVGHGRMPAVEVLVNHPQLAGLIRDDKLAQLPLLLAGGKLPGSTSLDEALDTLVRAGSVLAAEARRAAGKRERYKG